MSPTSGRKTYVRTKLKVTKEQLRHLDITLAGLHADTRLFLIHLTASVLFAARLSVPLSWEFIRDHFRDADYQQLIADGVIEEIEHSQPDGLSREYRLSPDWLAEFSNAAVRISNGTVPELYDAASSRPDRTAYKSRTLDRSRNPLPDIIRLAVEAILRSFFNATAIESHLEDLWQRAEAETDPSMRLRAWARHAIDSAAYATLLSQDCKEESGGLRSYRPAYRVLRTGRLHEIGAGLQSCSRAMKHAARLGVPDVYNYDLAASQARLLEHFMAEADISCLWLSLYLADPNRKVEAARTVGVSVDTWKRVLYALLMGAHVPALGQLKFSSGDLVKAIREDAGDQAFPTVYAQFLHYTEDLRNKLGEWHDYLVTDWLAQNGRRMPMHGKTFVRNAAGMNAAIQDLSPNGKQYKLKATLAAFLLQGAECAVIHRIAAAGADNGYTVMSNEHDGLVTLGAIPESVVTDAAAAVGLPASAVILVEKPFL